MVDIHAHILPGVDDGAADMNSALHMAAMAVESGVTTLAVTPHCMDFEDRENFWGDELAAEMLRFHSRLKKEKIPLRIVAGMEIFGTRKTPGLLREGKLIGINGSDYPLVEFAFYNYAAQATDIIEKIAMMGMRPVIAHPERYEYVQEDPSLLNLWTEMGCLFQINKGSLLGSFGRTEMLMAYDLVERGFAFAVASDAHSPVVRTTWMKDVQRLLKEEFSEETAKKLLDTNPAKIIRNEKIRGEEPRWFR